MIPNIQRIVVTVVIWTIPFSCGSRNHESVGGALGNRLGYIVGDRLGICHYSIPFIFEPKIANSDVET